MKMLHFALPEDQKSRRNIKACFLSVAAASLLLSSALLTGAVAQETAPAAAQPQTAAAAVPKNAAAAVETNSISRVSAQRAGKRLEIIPKPILPFVITLSD